MEMDYDLQLKQTQKLLMTPELRQALQILQFSSWELTDYVNQVLVENPLLEIKESVSEKGSIVGGRVVAPEFAWENIAEPAITLEEHLRAQLGCLPLDLGQRKIGHYLIGNLDLAGYLTLTVSQVAQALQVKPLEVQKMLSLLQTLEPAGIGARNLAECLLLQLERQNLRKKELEIMIEKHLSDLGQGRLQQVAMAMQLSVLRVQELFDLLKTLNPKPGAAWAGEGEAGYVFPDLLVEKERERYVVFLNDYLKPHLFLNTTYQYLWHQASLDQATVGFMENKYRQAQWLLQSIEQRQQTLYRLGVVLVQKQKEFLAKGLKYLRPLTLQEVATIMEVHESTVSRAVQHKYIQTPYGVFPLKFFFGSGVPTKTGKSLAGESIKQLLREIIEQEDKTVPYTDRELVEQLQKRGICIARRTVSKYRQELQILNTSQRRRFV